MKKGFSTYLVAKNRNNNLKWRVPSAMLAGIALLFPFQGFSRADDDHRATAITTCSTIINEAGRYFLANDLKAMFQIWSFHRGQRCRARAARAYHTGPGTLHQ